MLHWAVIFFIIAIASALFGFTGIEPATTNVAKTFFFVFLALFILSFVGGIVRRA
jgi:uncharacterized membrane protein YtjA (UPF0391 family)